MGVKEASRCGTHTHTQSVMNGGRIIFTSTVCARRNQQTPLGCRPQESSSLPGRRGDWGLKQTEPQLVSIPNGAPGSPTKHQILLRGCVGWTWVSARHSHRYVCGVWGFPRRGRTASFQALKEKQTASCRVEERCFCSYCNPFTLRIFGFAFWAAKTSYLALWGVYRDTAPPSGPVKL